MSTDTSAAADVPNLVGQIVSGLSANSLAIFKKGERIYAKKIGDRIGKYWVTDIRYRSVDIWDGSKTISIRVGDTYAKATPKPKMDGIEVLGQRVLVTSKLRDFIAKENLLTVMMQAASEMHYDYMTENGSLCFPLTLSDGDNCEWGLVGFKISEIDPGSIFEVAGIQNNDIITHISGKPLNSVFAAIQLLNTAKDFNAFSYTYIRDGVSSEVDINIVD